MTFQKGVSGNPAGRKPGIGDLDKELRNILRRRDPAAGKTGARVIAEALYSAATHGSVPALCYMHDRVLGRPAQSVQVSGDVDRPIHIVAGLDQARTFPALGAQPSLAEPSSTAPELGTESQDGRETPSGDSV